MTRNKTSWKKGECGNPKGRPKGSLNIAARLEKALENETKNNGIHLIDYTVRRCYKDTRVLLLIQKK